MSFPYVFSGGGVLSKSMCCFSSADVIVYLGSIWYIERLSKPDRSWVDNQPDGVWNINTYVAYLKHQGGISLRTDSLQGQKHATEGNALHLAGNVCPDHHRRAAQTICPSASHVCGHTYVCGLCEAA